MHKATIRFPEGQWKALRAVAEQQRVSVAELIRTLLSGFDQNAPREIQGWEIGPILLARLREHHRAHRKIQAIKVLRDAFRPAMGLKEAKDVVDQLWREWATA